MKDKQREEWIEEKAREMMEIIAQYRRPLKVIPLEASTFKAINLNDCKDFIRTLLEEHITIEYWKPKVSKEFIEKWNQTIAERVNVQMKKDFVREEIGLVYPGTENLTQMLEKVGCEVEK